MQQQPGKSSLTNNLYQ